MAVIFLQVPFTMKRGTATELYINKRHDDACGCVKKMVSGFYQKEYIQLKHWIWTPFQAYFNFLFLCG